MASNHDTKQKPAQAEEPALTLGVKVRERPKGSGIWWLFIDYKGHRKARKCGSKELADEAAKYMRSQIAFGIYDPTVEQPKKIEAPKTTLKEYYQEFERVDIQNMKNRHFNKCLADAGLHRIRFHDASTPSLHYSCKKASPRFTLRNSSGTTL